MLTVLKEKRVEVAKAFAYLLVFGLLYWWDFLPKNYLAGELVRIFVDAVVAVLAVFLIADVMLGRPKVTLEWRTKSFDRPVPDEIHIRGNKQSINLQVKVDGKSSLQRFLLRRSQRKKFVIHIQASPAGIVKLIKQSGPPDFNAGADRESLAFEKILVDASNTVAYADFAVKRRSPAAGYEQVVKIDVSARWEPKILWMPVTLANVESGIERLVLEG